MIRRIILLLVLLAGINQLSFAAHGYHRVKNTQCQLISGQIIQLANHQLFTFQASAKLNQNNYPLTHTKFYVQDNSGSTYEVIVDNLFYNKLTDRQASSNKNIDILDDFNSNYKVGDNVDACGKLITKGHKPAIHFVHRSECRSNQFDGYLKIKGVNITDSSKYCNQCSCYFNQSS